MRFGSICFLVVALCACNSNGEEANTNYKAAVDKYCACAAEQAKVPANEVDTDSCKPHYEEANKLFEAMPHRGKDPETKKISDMSHVCYQQLDAMWKAKNEIENAAAQ